MRTFLRVLKWVWTILIIGPVIGIIVGLAPRYLETTHIPISPEVALWLTANSRLLIVILILLIVLTLTTRYLSRREENASLFKAICHYFLVLKRVKDLDPLQDFTISRYDSYYFARRALDIDVSPPQEVQADESAISLFKEEKTLLIIGKPKQGKTRLVYQILQGFPEYFVIKPLPEELRIEALDFSPLRRQPVILFLDDLNQFIDRFDPEALKHRIEQSGCPCRLLATCRDGDELKAVEQKLSSFYATRLRKLHLQNLSEEDGMRLAKVLKVEWPPPGGFDGTPGSILLGLQDMALRYKSLDDYPKSMMKAIKLLYHAGIYTYWHRRTKAVTETVFGLPETPYYKWQEHLRSLAERGFLTRSEDPLEVEDAYLGDVISDYPHPEADFPALVSLLRQMEDHQALFQHGTHPGLAGRYKEALESFEEAIQLKPDFAEAWNNKGVTLGELNRYDEALAACEEAIRLKPDFAEAWNNRGVALGKLDRREEELKALEEAIRLKPDYDKAWYNKGVVLVNLGRHVEALTTFEEAIRLKPDFAEAWNSKGAVLFAAGRHKEALTACEEAIRLKPDYPEAWYNKGTALYAEGRHEEVLKALEEAIRLKPDYPEAWQNKGAALGRLGRYQEELQAYDKTIRLKPDLAEAWNNKGVTLGKLGRYEEQLKAYGEAIRLKPDHAKAWNNKGAALYALGRHLEALAAFEEVIRLKPDNAKAWNDKGAALFVAGRHKEALTAFEEATRLKPDYAEAWHNKGVVLDKLGRNEEALPAYEEAVRLKPDYAEAWYNKGSALDKSGRHLEALSAYEEATRLKPDFAEAWYNKGMVLSNLGRHGEAWQAYYQAEKLSTPPEKARQTYKADITIIGAGVVGLAIAAALGSEKRDVYVLEKNDSFGKETSSRHSGVIHSGIYYPKDSLKAKLCVAGNHRLYELCKRYGVPHARMGKLIVATGNEELEELQALFQKGQANDAEGLRLISKQEVNALEPNVSAVAALWSPSTGIIDSHALMQSYVSQAVSKGVQIAYKTKVVGVEKLTEGYRVTVQDESETFSFTTRILINCAGLYCDKIAELTGIDIDKAGYRLHYCKGEYFSVSGGKNKLVKRLIYPVPPETTGLGIHITLDMDGRMKLGPSAYYVDSIDYAIDSRNKQRFYEAVKRLLPQIELDDLEPDMAGIRPKLQAPGEDVKDYVIREESNKGLPGLINLIGIESPGLTASPAIAELVGKMVKELS